MHFAILQCNTIVHSSKQVFCRLSVYSWEGRRALSYTKSYILINFMVHLHYYQSHIQISSRDNIVHGRMFHYLICISIDLRGKNARQYVSLWLGSVSEHYPRLWDPQKKILEAWPSWLIGNRAWLYLAAYIRGKNLPCVFLIWIHWSP